MFNRKFDKLVKEKPWLFEYNFERPEGKDSAEREAQINELVGKSTRKPFAKKQQS